MTFSWLLYVNHKLANRTIDKLINESNKNNLQKRKSHVHLFPFE